MTHFRDISEIKPPPARPRPPPPHPGRQGCRGTRPDRPTPTALFIWPLNGPAGGAAGGPPGEIGGSRASEGRSDGLVGAPSPQGDGAGRRDGRNEGLGGLGARAPGTGGGARAGPSGATQVAPRCFGGAWGLCSSCKAHFSARVCIAKPACRRTPRELVCSDPKPMYKLRRSINSTDRTSPSSRITPPLACVLGRCPWQSAAATRTSHVHQPMSRRSGSPR